MQHSQPLDLEKALSLLAVEIAPIERTEQIALADCVGRILDRDTVAPVDLPPFAASAMDGYAVSGQADQYTRVGTSYAGHPYNGVLSHGECVRIFTGAAVPDGTTRVIIQEELQQEQEDQVQFKPHTASENYIRPIGHDILAGSVLVPGGTLINAYVQGALAAAGLAQVSVRQKPKVGVFSTGDELTEPGTALLPGQIYDSNRRTVLSLLERTPCEVLDLGRLPDDRQAIRGALSDSAGRCDALITSGGVSVGEADFVTEVIRELGSLSFWKLNLKPGKPLAFGSLGSCRIFGLPGNPVSTIVTLLMVAKPALHVMAGGVLPEPLRMSATLTGGVAHTPGRAEYQRGYFQKNGRRFTVFHTGDQSSNRLSSFVNANCLIEVPKHANDLPAGSEVTILPLEHL